MSSIQIETWANGQQPLISMLEGNLDMDEVTFTRHENAMAIKSIIPLDFILHAVSEYAFEEFFLKPLIGPFAEKWQKGVKRWLHPLQPFNLTIKIADGAQLIVAPIGENLQITEQIWVAVRQAIDILKARDLWQDGSQLKFIPDDADELRIFYCQAGQPLKLVWLETANITDIPENLMPLAS